MISTIDKYDINARKEMLERHRQRLVDLERQGKWREALEQFNVTLRYAIESLEHSIDTLSEVNDQIDRLPAPQRERMSRIALTTMTASLYDFS